ncbi:hypothetical protein AB1Y20_000450 [Prymnesium parvum]|uniref:Peroxin-5 n=1 Tax=Prymnesium parvum TaxID=97485 RepID=A0AB34K6H2_PRYPA
MNETEEEMLMSAAAMHEDQNMLDEAAAAYKQVLHHNPYNVHALSQLASISRHQERFHDAVMYLQRIVQLDSTNGELHGAVGHCFLMLSQRATKMPAILEALRQGYNSYSEAIVNLKDPADPNLWYGIGLLYERYAALFPPCDQKMAALKLSAEALFAVLRMDPAFEKRSEIYYRLGLLFQQQGHSQQSLECFRAICDSPPPPLKPADVWYQIGYVHETVEPTSPSLAKRAYEHALQLSEQSADVKVARSFRQLGWVCHTSGLQGAMPALIYLQRAVETDPYDCQNWHHLGKCLADHGQILGAYDCYQQAVLRDAMSHEVWASVGALFTQARQDNDAVIAYHRAVTLNQNSKAWMPYACALEACAIQDGDLTTYDAAMKAFSHALKVIPSQEREIHSRMQRLHSLHTRAAQQQDVQAYESGPSRIDQLHSPMPDMFARLTSAGGAMGQPSGSSKMQLYDAAPAARLPIE